MQLYRGIVAIAISAGMAQAGIASIVLDDFDSDPNTNAGGVGDYSSIVFNNPFNQGSSFTLETVVDTGSDIGAVVFNSGIGVEYGASISYSNSGAGLDFDGAASGVQSFELDFAMVDQGFEASIVLTTFDDMGNAVGDARLAVSIAAGTSITASWNLASFTTSGAFDASNIDDVTLSFNPEDNVTASLDFIATEFRAMVPSPGPLALLGLGGMLIARRGRM